MNLLAFSDYITNGPSQNTRQLIALETPMSYFILPLEKRFRFHFYVSEKTSRPEKVSFAILSHSYVQASGSSLQGATQARLPQAHNSWSCVLVQHLRDIVRKSTISNWYTSF